MTGFSLDQFKAAITAAFPEFNVTSISEFRSGWANQTCLVNERFVFRFPFDLHGKQQLLREIDLLPVLAPKLPILIPEYKFVSFGNRQYPYPIVGYELLPGESIPHPPESLRQAMWWRYQAADFLTALHRIAIDENIAGLIEGYQTAQEWKDVRLAKHALYQQYVFPLLPVKTHSAIFEDLNAAAQDDRMVSFRPVILHQDFDFHNFLVDLEQEQITGVIDFGSITIGDPAVDVCSAVKPFYQGFIDPGWDFRRDYYHRTGALEDLLYLFTCQHVIPDKKQLIQRKLAEISRIWL